MTSERNALVEEMTLLKQQAGISLQPLSAHKGSHRTVFLSGALTTKAVVLHALQIIILIGYFLWEDHVWRSYRH